MVSTVHAKHLATNVSWNNCDECRADCERKFVPRDPWPGYQFVGDYLAWSKPRLDAVRAMPNDVDARIWHRDWVKALHRRISLKQTQSAGRKRCDSYLERLGQARRWNDARTFASRGASCLEYGRRDLTAARAEYEANCAGDVPDVAHVA